MADRFIIETGIAKNNALKENLFIMFVSIMNKIPLFLTGSPGTSKTLAINIIISSLKGKNSTDSFLKTLPSVNPVFYQGHL